MRAIIEIAHTLEAQVIAGGLETAQQLAILRTSRCDLVQGYMLCGPLTAASFLMWVE